MAVFPDPFALRPAKPPTEPDPSAATRVRLLPVLAIAAGALLVVKSVEAVTQIGVAQAAGGEAKKEETEEDKPLATFDMSEATKSAGPKLLRPEPVVAPPLGSTSIAAEKPAEATPTVGGTCGPRNIGEEAGLSFSEVRILQSLSDRRKGLDDRERDIDTREQIIEAAAKKVDGRITELKGIEAKVQTLLRQLNGQEGADVSMLVRVYEKMKPKDAALVFETLDEDILVPVAAGMKETILAQVLGNMTAPKAKRLTELLARRAKVDPLALDKAGPPKAAGT